jgi:hypothetical protein
MGAGGGAAWQGQPAAGLHAGTRSHRLKLGGLALRKRRQLRGALALPAQPRQLSIRAALRLEGAAAGGRTREEEGG